LRLAEAFVLQIPSSVLYIKNGKGKNGQGEYWDTAKTRNQIHAGWRKIPADVIRNFDAAKIDNVYHRHYPDGTGQDLNALKRLLDKPSQHVWITMENGFLWWCLVKDKANASDRDREGQGHLWLECARPWSNTSLGGRKLTRSDLPGSVQKVAGFKGTVCQPEAWDYVLRIIRDQPDAKVAEANRRRADYAKAMRDLISDLGDKDFEQLVELILIRSGWERISKESGGVQEGIDLDVENAAAGERAFVQVKSTADQKILDQYVRRFKAQRKTYNRMIFAVHSPKGRLRVSQQNVRVWGGEQIAQLVVRLGLGERVEKMRGHLERR
jgi:hypothetical protein